jgi:hypothetical protein
MKFILSIFLILSFNSLIAQEQQNPTSNPSSKETSVTDDKKEEKKDDKEEDDDHNEIKLNLFMPLFSSLEITYERLIKNQTAFGLSLGYGLEYRENNNFESFYQWSILPYYRVYFGKKKSAGFFIEANAHASHSKKIDYYFNYTEPEYQVNTDVDKNFNYGLGVAIGLKLLSVKKLTGEIFTGVGRYFNEEKAYPRVGITLGKRF